jgi:hypothetical protein
VFAYLEAKRVYTVSDTSAIDDGAFEWLADCVGFFYASDLAGRNTNAANSRVHVEGDRVE